MGASTTVTRTVSFRDEPDALLDYLVARTAETVGRRVERSNVVVLARVAQAVDGGTVRLAVERLLAGALPDGDVLVEAPATPAATAPPDPGPTLVPGGRAVFFLTRADRAQPVFRPAGGRYGVVDDDEALVEQTAAAAEWYAKLPHEPDPRAPALRAAIVDANPRVARTAVRALADERLPEGADALEEALPRVDDDLGVRLMLGLWTLGRRKRAIELLESEYAAAGRDAWLRRWGLAHSVDAKGQTEAVLFGPDPAEVKGD